MQTRIEHDTMGEVAVPSEALWENIFVADCKCGTGLIETKCERIGRFVVGRVVLER